MRIRQPLLCCTLSAIALLASGSEARAQGAQAQGSAEGSRFVLDLGVGLDASVNGNVNSGAIGVLQGQATAILPSPYGDVYGTGLQLRFGGGWLLNEESELRGVFTYQSADADLVRLGDIGPSSLYAQFSDYKSLALDFGYRRYMPLERQDFRVYGEATLGLAFIDEISAVFAAPQAGIVFEQTDLFDRTSAFTLGISAGVLFPIAELIDLNVQAGLRRVSGLSEVDQLVGTGLEGINDDSARLTFPVVVGVRFRFR
jgi:hypothetical protein